MNEKLAPEVIVNWNVNKLMYILFVQEIPLHLPIETEPYHRLGNNFFENKIQIVITSKALTFTTYHLIAIESSTYFIITCGATRLSTVLLLFRHVGPGTNILKAVGVKTMCNSIT